MGDEDFYQRALQEFDSGDADEGLLAKAWVQANGDDSLQKVEYVKLRVNQLKAAKIKRIAAVAGTAAKTAAPGILGLAFFVVKAIVLIAVAAGGVALLAEATGDVNPGNIVGFVLAGILVIYLISRALEWMLLKRILKNRNLMVALSASISFALIVLLWWAGSRESHEVHPEILAKYLIASIIVILARSNLSALG